MPAAIRFLTVLLLLLAALGLSCPPAAQAATTFYVSPVGNDGNAGTQATPKQHVQAAINAALSGDTVILADGVYSGDGNRDLDCGGKNLTIASLNGPSRTILDCGGSSASAHRGFYCHSGENAVLTGLTIQHSQAAYGGGVAVESGCTVTLTNCVLTGNTADDGGGIYNHGTLTLTGCTLTGNTAASGGGLDNDTGTVTLTGCTFTGNTAPVGAGVENSGAATLTNCILSGNTAVNGYGGGVFNDVGTVTLLGCALAANSAAYGAGIYNDATLTLSGCALTGNTASFYEWLAGTDGSHYLGNGGGGIFNMGGDARLTSCTLADNSAIYGGGLLNNSGALTLSGCTLTGNSAAPAAFGSGLGLGGSGGGIFNGDTSGNGSAGMVTLTDDILFADSAARGGGEALSGSAESGTVRFDHCDVGSGLPAGNGDSDGGGNITADPLFVLAPTDLHLQAASPCLGAGTPVNGLTVDKDGSPRPNSPAIGAYEGHTGQTHVLWHNAGTGQTALWTVGTDGGILGHVYGPYDGWTSQFVADGPDGLARILWSNANGSISLWSVDADGTTSGKVYGGLSGWTALGQAVGPDTHVHVLWSHNADGQTALWDVDSTGAPSGVAYGPYPGWTAAGLTVGPDNHTHLLWDNANGSIALWDIAPGAAPVGHAYGATAGYTGAALAAGPDNHVHVLWNNANGGIALWDIGSAGTPSGSVYGPYSGYTASSLAVGSDNHIHMLWNVQSGGNTLWDLAPGANPTAAVYNPGGGWAAVAVSAAP